jgi:predicted RNA-binding Zn ribbon-like protein
LASDPGNPSNQRELDMALELREALRGVLRSHVTRRNSPRQPGPTGGFNSSDAHDSRADVTGSSAATRVADVAAAMRTGIRVEGNGRIVVVPAGTGAAAALTRLLLIGAEAATAGNWTRLKVCSADDCQWAFYDRSPTHNGCWCSMQICGSRAKSRAYRGRAARTS